MPVTDHGLSTLWFGPISSTQVCKHWHFKTSMSDLSAKLSIWAALSTSIWSSTLSLSWIVCKLFIHDSTQTYIIDHYVIRLVLSYNNWYVKFLSYFFHKEMCSHEKILRLGNDINDFILILKRQRYTGRSLGSGASTILFRILFLSNFNNNQGTYEMRSSSFNRPMLVVSKGVARSFSRGGVRGYFYFLEKSKTRFWGWCMVKIGKLGEPKRSADPKHPAAPTPMVVSDMLLYINRINNVGAGASGQSEHLSLIS